MINKVILIGNAGSDPEEKQTENGSNVRLSLATNEVYRNSKGERKEITEWHKLRCFNSVSDYVKKRVKKGMRLYIEGKLHTESWQNEKGDWQSITFIRVDTIKILNDNKPASEATDEESASEIPTRE